MGDQPPIGDTPTATRPMLLQTVPSMFTLSNETSAVPGSKFESRWRSLIHEVHLRTGLDIANWLPSNNDDPFVASLMSEVVAHHPLAASATARRALIQDIRGIEARR
jgi:hypothetical protein